MGDSVDEYVYNVYHDMTYNPDKYYYASFDDKLTKIKMEKMLHKAKNNIKKYFGCFPNLTRYINIDTYKTEFDSYQMRCSLDDILFLLHKHNLIDIHTTRYAIFYIELFISKCRTKITHTNFPLLFLVSFTISQKFWNDICVSSNVMCYLFCVPKYVFYHLEIYFLKQIDYKLYSFKNNM